MDWTTLSSGAQSVCPVAAIASNLFKLSTQVGKLFVSRKDRAAHLYGHAPIGFLALICRRLPHRLVIVAISIL
jgi:hypothetical protein